VYTKSAGDVPRIRHDHPVPHTMTPCDLAPMIHNGEKNTAIIHAIIMGRTNLIAQVGSPAAFSFWREVNVWTVVVASHPRPSHHIFRVCAFIFLRKTLSNGVVRSTPSF
jgi:hypothetical protein